MSRTGQIMLATIVLFTWDHVMDNTLYVICMCINCLPSGCDGVYLPKVLSNLRLWLSAEEYKLLPW